MYESKLDTLVERYFNHIERRITVSAGSVLIEQDGYNERLYYVLSGELAGYFSEDGKSRLRCLRHRRARLLVCTVSSLERGLPLQR